ncbi:hypothetical protein [Streptomyces sp. NPDC101776]|uniref:hypothetical protein n=1 Tax=Streptomyces sp. NPDC101776 TaxID=3366146 RepID=UPI0037FB3E46
MRLLYARHGKDIPRGALLRRLPVLPADLRPVIVHEGRIYVSPLNAPYKQVVSRASRLRRLIALEATSVVIRHEGIQLQEAVNSLFEPGEAGAHSPT